MTRGVRYEGQPNTTMEEAVEYISKSIFDVDPDSVLQDLLAIPEAKPIVLRVLREELRTIGKMKQDSDYRADVRGGMEDWAAKDEKKVRALINRVLRV